MSVNESRDIDNGQINNNVSCNICGTGFTDHQENNYRLHNLPRKPINGSFDWNEKPGTTFVKGLNNTYDKILYWRKTCFFFRKKEQGKVLSTK